MGATTPLIVAAVPFSGSGVDVDVTIDALLTDTVLLCRGTEDDGAGNWVNPTGDTGSGTPVSVKAQSTSTETSIQVWRYPLTTPGEHVLHSLYDGSGENSGYAFVLRNTYSPALDGTPGGASVTTNSGTFNAPSTNPSGVDDLLFCLWQHRSALATGITIPGQMTKFDAVRLCIGVEELAASGATGNRLASASSDGWSAVSFAIRGIAAAGPTKKRGQYAALFPGGV